MIRQQVYLTEEQVRDIKLRAKRERKRAAEIIRELLTAGLRAARAHGKESTGGVPASLGGNRRGWTNPKETDRFPGPLVSTRSVECPFFIMERSGNKTQQFEQAGRRRR
jgi:hypothetical protein